MVANIHKSQSRWAHLSRALGREGADPWTSRIFQGVHSGNAVVCIVNLYDELQDLEDPWLIPPQGVPPYGDNANEVRHGRVVVIPAYGCINGGGGD